MNKTPFSSLPFSEKILTAVKELGYEFMTPIQEQSLPVLLEGKDVIGQSKTGSGKTAAFTLPMLQNIRLGDKYPQGLVLCPTRELSSQVAREVRSLGRRFDGLQVVIVCGGMPSRDQRQAIENGAHIVVGTPGRVLDMLERGVLDLRDVSTLVLDEADKMLEMGFEDEVSAILEAVPTNRQTVLFSATFPDGIVALSQQHQKNPVTIKVEEPAEQITIQEIAYETDGEDKIDLLMRVLQQHPARSAIIFCNQKVTIQEIYDRLEGTNSAPLHGDLEQRDRDRVMAMFRNGSYRFLIATDVAARGLDVENLELVVNFDLPKHVETYIHRIGRTGRAGKSGVAVSLYSSDESAFLYEISQQTGRKFDKPKLGFKNQHGLSIEFRTPQMRTLVISGGRKDKLRPGDILGALTGIGELNGNDVGKIEVHDHITFVAVKPDVASQALKNLRNGKIKTQKFRIHLQD